MFGMCCLGKELSLGTLWHLSPAQDFWSRKQKEGMQVYYVEFTQSKTVYRYIKCPGGISGIFMKNRHIFMSYVFF